ncbi:MAG: carotenoid 1,2-hydratase [SAR324 cluster bacterium]|nr:carotenoid 1,2-hydratase [SAR324 cluster bacterium]
MKQTSLLKGILLTSLLALFVAAVFALFHDEDRSKKPRRSLSVSETLSGDSKGFAQALVPRPFKFPDDHGAHPEFRNEWWYFTGNLKTPEGRHFGYQFTLFRTSLSNQTISSPSQWASRQIYMGHLAVTDSQAKKYFHFERFSRAAIDLAGARAHPFHVWLENWFVSSRGNSFFPLTIQASEGDLSLLLNLTSEKQKVLQGIQGLSKKGHQPGNASYYYSFTRLKSEGQLFLDGIKYELEGLSWMDREWSSSVLEAQQSGWDWFAVQLSNGWELMYYQLRLKNGKTDSTSSGVLVSPKGQSFRLEHHQVALKILDTWTSSSTGIRYPSQWELKVPDRQISLTLTPRLAEQEFESSFTYWEGAVQVQGLFQNKAVRGEAYVELTGYTKADP